MHFVSELTLNLHLGSCTMYTVVVLLTFLMFKVK